MAQSERLPIITDAHISFTCPYFINDFLINTSKINSDYLFLKSVDEYASYYEKNERATNSSLVSINILNLENNLFLKPLKLKETLNSYWKSFRVPIKILKSKGQEYKHLFQFLPLKIDLPKKSLTVKGTDIKIKTFSYLFPFGSFVTNMSVKLHNKSFDEMIDLINNIKRAVFYKKEKEKKL